jgi:periplasmic copper chaperone A
MKKFVLSATLALACAASFAQAVEVTGAWVRPTVTGQKAGGGFVTLKNTAQQDDKLLRASSEVARMELHTMSMDGNVMRMREVPNIEVKAGQSVALKPGGLHLMFMDIKSPLKNGETVNVVLEFERAGKVTVPFKIAPRDPATVPPADPSLK